MSDSNSNANQLHTQENKSKSNDDSILLVKFSNHENHSAVIFTLFSSDHINRPKKWERTISNKKH